MQPTKTTAHVLLTLALLASTSLAQVTPEPARERELRPRWQRAKPVDVAIHAGQDPSRIVLKLTDEAPSPAGVPLGY